MKKIYQVEVDCPNCANEMEQAAKKVKGVLGANISFMTQKMTIEIDDNYDNKKVIEEVVKVCHKVEPDCQIFLN